MNLDERVGAAIRVHADELQPRVPDLATIRAGARRQARRRAAIGVAALTTAVVVAWTTVVDDLVEKRSLPPVDVPDGRIVLIPDARSQQVVVEPEITSVVEPGEFLDRTVSTDDPEYDGGGSLELVFSDAAHNRMEATCQGAPDAWYVLLIDPGATYIDTGPCDGSIPQTPGRSPEISGKAARIFVTEKNPREFRKCFNYSPPEGCAELEHLAAGSQARMTLSTYEWREGPDAVTMFGRSFPSRASAFNQAWSLTHAAAAPTGGRQVSFTLAASPRERIANIVTVQGDPQPCPGATDCHPDIELTVDGELVPIRPDDGPFFSRANWALLGPDAPHDVTVRLVGGEPTILELGIVVYAADA